MAIIKVNEFLETAFDMEDAEILKEKIMQIGRASCRERV